jgi:hypothetical protein
LPLFCDTALAERIERVEAELIARASEAADRRSRDAAGFVIPIAGGAAIFAEEGSPFTKVAGSASAVCRARPRSTRSSAPSPPAAPPCR